IDVGRSGESRRRSPLTQRVFAAFSEMKHRCRFLVGARSSLMRFRLALALVLITACANTPAPAEDASMSTDASLRADAPASQCTTACTGGQLCCPVALSYACVAPTAAGV